MTGKSGGVVVKARLRGTIEKLSEDGQHMVVQHYEQEFRVSAPTVETAKKRAARTAAKAAMELIDCELAD